MKNIFRDEFHIKGIKMRYLLILSITLLGNHLLQAQSGMDGKFNEVFPINTSFTSSVGWNNAVHMRTLADVNGDGKADLVGAGNEMVYVQLGLGDGKFGPFTAANDGFFSSKDGWENASHVRTAADVNGDGRADLVGIGNDKVFVQLGQADGKFGGTIEAHGGFFTRTVGGWNNTDGIGVRKLADVNGDGRADLVGIGWEKAFVALGQADGKFGPAKEVNGKFFTSNQGGWNDVNGNCVRTLADVNGDKKADIVGIGGDGVYVALGKADGNFADIIIANGAYFTLSNGWNNTTHLRTLADVNGDGRADLVGFGNEAVHIALGQADGKFGTPFQSNNTFFITPNGWTEQTFFRGVADVNGDRKADLVGIGQDGSFVALSSGPVLVEPGTVYYIKPSDTDNLLGLEKTVQKAGGTEGPVTLRENWDADYHKWVFILHPDQTYSIQNVQTKTYLRVNKESKDPGTAMLVGRDENLPQQRFKLVPNSYGTSIISVYNGLAMTVKDAGTGLGTPLIQSSSQGTKNQSFSFVPLIKDKILTSGQAYSIQARHSGKYLTSSPDGFLTQYAPHGWDLQHWVAVNVGDGYWAFIQAGSQNAITVDHTEANIKSTVEIKHYTGLETQKFKLEETDNGFVKIVSKGGLVLDVYYGWLHDGVKVFPWTYHGSEFQQFKFGPPLPADGAAPPPAVLWDGPLRVADANNLGITFSNDNNLVLTSGMDAINFIMKPSGAIVLKDNPTIGLSVSDPKLTSGSRIVLSAAYNLWELVPDGSIVLRDNPSLGLAVQNQQMVTGTSLILHEGFNKWTKEKPNLGVTYEMSVEIVCVTENDGGGVAEEIFGNLNVATPTGDFKLWERGEDAAESINEGAVYQVPQKTLLNGLNLNSSITVGGHLYEEDTGGDDDLGTASATKTIQEFLNGPVTLEYVFEGTKIHVRYSLKQGRGKYITIESIKCIKPSAGTDGATQVGIDIGIVFGTIAVAAGVAFIPAVGPELADVIVDTGIGLAADNEFAKEHGKNHPGADDLYFTINNVKVWPVNDSKVDIVSQQTLPVELTFKFDENAVLALWDDDVSADDCLGTWKFTKEISSKNISIGSKEEDAWYDLILKVVDYE